LYLISLAIPGIVRVTILSRATSPVSNNIRKIGAMQKLKSGATKLGIRLNDEQLDKFEVYYRELIAWNKKFNLTRITDYEEVQVKHFLDSLTILMAIKLSEGLRVIDIGTGAGLPGIPLKIVFSGINLTLLEATAKKATFLEHLVSGLGLDRVAIAIGRAEDIGRDNRYRERFDLALSRAVAPLPVLVELALPFCSVGGVCIAQKKGDIGKEMAQARQAIEIMGGNLREVKLVALAELNDERCLVIIDKIRPTPPEYPRRPGRPTKRPILS
jgi:16S rRNA (guanine527-N7)-methyltransferase